MKGFKGFDKDMKCRGKQYCEKQTFEEKDAMLCEKGIHFCENPLDVLNYYGILDCDGEQNRFAKVKTAFGAKVDKGEDKNCTTKLNIEEEISFEELVNNYFGPYGGKKYDKGEVIYSNNIYFSANGSWDVNVSRSNHCIFGSIRAYAHNISTGADTKISMYGNNSKTLTSGDYTTVFSCGENNIIEALGKKASLLSSAPFASIRSRGESSYLVSTGKHASLVSRGSSNNIIAGLGDNNVAKGEIGDWLVLAEYEGERVVCVKSAQIDGKKLKPNVFYGLINGKFHECNVG